MSEPGKAESTVRDPCLLCPAPREEFETQAGLTAITVMCYGNRLEVPIGDSNSKTCPVSR